MSDRDNQLLGRLKRGLLIAFSAPAGTGKTTLAKKLIAKFPKQITQSISCTTRPRRVGEVDGKDYIFVTKEAFEEKKARGEFVETIAVFGADYGTLRETIEKERQAGKHVIAVIDTCGALVLKAKEGARLIFLLPPSLAVLKERLKKRETESKQTLEERLKRVHFEIDQAQFFDYQVINEDLDLASKVLTSIFIAEEHRLDNV